MNWDEAAGKWSQFKGSVKEKWGRLTDDDLTAIDGKRETLVGKLQQRYGIAKEEAEAQIRDWKIPSGKMEESRGKMEDPKRKAS